MLKENKLQRKMICKDSSAFVWYGTNYKVDAEPNNGRGQADFIISMGQKIKVLSSLNWRVNLLNRL